MTFQIQRGFSDEQRPAIAQVYWAAFSRKLAPILGDSARTLAVLAETFDPAACLIAVDDEGRIMGVSGIEYEDGQFLRYRLSVMRAHYGSIGGVIRWLVMQVIHTAGDGKTVYISGLAVHPDARGQGVGTLLIEAVTAIARERSYDAVKLDVVDSNDDARRLYERLGFRAVRTARYPFLSPLGFTGVTTMVKPISLTIVSGHPSRATPPR